MDIKTARAKKPSESETETVHIIMPMHLNGFGRLFGGQLALWIDEIAGVVARRHCNQQITTVSIDNLRFREAVFQNTMLFLRGRITYVGNTSMEIRVDSFAEDMSGTRRLINTAFVTQVAIDENGRPCKVPELVLTNFMEEQEFASGQKRRESNKKLNFEAYD